MILLLELLNFPICVKLPVTSVCEHTVGLDGLCWHNLGYIKLKDFLDKVLESLSASRQQLIQISLVSLIEIVIHT